MANPVVMPVRVPATTELLVDKKRKLETLPATTAAGEPHKKLQCLALEENVDYLSLQSSLSLLQARLGQIQREIRELSQFKKCIRESSNVKEAAKLVSSHTDYLKEIHYKGSYVKCPVINWEREYGLEINYLNEQFGTDDVVDCYEKINEQYEIIKRDKLFN